jgi:hypothetical protein
MTEKKEEEREKSCKKIYLLRRAEGLLAIRHGA